jgi:hypothetical protein
MSLKVIVIVVWGTENSRIGEQIQKVGINIFFGFKMNESHLESLSQCPQSHPVFRSQVKIMNFIFPVVGILPSEPKFQFYNFLYSDPDEGAISVERIRLNSVTRSISFGPSWICTTWRRRQNAFCESLCFKSKTGRCIMLRNVTVTLMYQRHKPIDSNNLFGS